LYLVGGFVEAERLLHLWQQIFVQELHHLGALGMHDTIETEVQVRLVELEQLLQQRLQLLVFLAHCMSRSSLHHMCRHSLVFQASPGSPMRRIRRYTRFRAVPPSNTSQSGAVSAAAITARAWTTCQSFSTRAGLGKPQYAWISSGAWSDGLSLK